MSQNARQPGDRAKAVAIKNAGVVFGELRSIVKDWDDTPPATVDLQWLQKLQKDVQWTADQLTNVCDALSNALTHGND